MTDEPLTVTVRARIPDPRHDEILYALGERFGSLTRSLISPLADILAIRDAKTRKAAYAALKRETCARHRVSARYYNSARMAAEGLVRGRKESADRNLSLLRKRSRAEQGKLRRLGKELAKAEKADAAERAEFLRRSGRPCRRPESAEISRIRCLIRNRTRRLDSLGARILRETAQKERPTGIMIGRGAMRRRHLMTGPEFDAAWRRARSGNVLIAGSGDEADGNQSCKIDLSDLDRGLIHVRVRPMTAGAVRTEDWVLIRDVPLSDHAVRALLAVRGRVRAREEAALLSGGRALGTGEPVTVRFLASAPPATPGRPPASDFEILVTVREEVPARVAPSGLTLGVDLNADHAAWAVINAQGNPVATGTVPMPLRQLTSGQRDAVIGDACAELVRIAVLHGCDAIAIEDLDLSGKAPARFADASRAAAALPTRKFAETIRRRAVRAGLRVSAVNPAWTSVLGRVNYSYPNGLTVHEGAAIVIARRSRGLSERVRNHRQRRLDAVTGPEDTRSRPEPPDPKTLAAALRGFAASERVRCGRFRAPSSRAEWAETLAAARTLRSGGRGRARSGANP